MSFVFKKVNAGKPAKQLTLVEQVFSWGSYLYAKSARSGWVLGTSMLLLVFPLWLDIQREMSLQEYEQQMIELFVTSLFLFAFSLIIRKKKKKRNNNVRRHQFKGYSTGQIVQLQQSGGFGIPPPPPPSQPQFP